MVLTKCNQTVNYCVRIRSETAAPWWDISRYYFLKLVVTCAVIIIIIGIIRMDDVFSGCFKGAVFFHCSETGIERDFYEASHFITVYLCCKTITKNCFIFKVLQSIIILYYILYLYYLYYITIFIYYLTRSEYQVSSINKMLGTIEL